MELNRIHSHLVGLGTTALDLGAISMFWYCFRERDTILDLFEMSSGQRMHTRYFQVGGVIEDIPVGFERKVQGVLRADAGAHRPVRRRCSTRTRSSCSGPRTSASSPASGCSRWASPARCCAPPASPGTCARSSDYLPYEDFDFQIPIGTVGDNYDRYRVRAERDARVGADHRAGDRRPARGSLGRRRPQGRAAPAPRARHLDGGADPPLQARHRGLPRAARRGLLPGRVARAASSAASSSPTARRSRSASTCASRRSSTCRRCGRCASAGTSPT